MDYRPVLFLLFFYTIGFSQTNKNKQGYRYFEEPSLTKKWKLDSAKASLKNETFKIEKHQSIYAVFTSNLTGANEQPSSENPLNTLDEPIDFKNAELKFQLSFKTLVFDDIFGSQLDFWAAYTQSSRWQVFNAEISRPFRETNYEPEGILIHPVNIEFLNLNLAYIGLSLNHQSNGRSLPLSRSWNRIIVEAGIQGRNYTLQLRPWFRLNEDLEEDDNPEVTNFIGRGEALFTFVHRRFKLQTNMRHTLRFGDNNRGSVSVSVDYKLQNALSLNLQVFHGYGESLLDYNYKQTMLSFGVSFL